MTTYFYHIRERCGYQYVRVVLSDDTSMAVAARSCNRMFAKFVFSGLDGLGIIGFVSLSTQTTLARRCSVCCQAETFDVKQRRFEAGAP